MKRLAAFALVILSCAPAKAQFGGMGGMGGGMAVRPMTPAESIDLEIMQMEQEADKAALKEALLAQARLGMKPVPGGKAEKEQKDQEAPEPNPAPRGPNPTIQGSVVPAPFAPPQPRTLPPALDAGPNR